MNKEIKCNCLLNTTPNLPISLQVKCNHKIIIEKHINKVEK